jgi:hypothetical protein
VVETVMTGVVVAVFVAVAVGAAAVVVRLYRD